MRLQHIKKKYKFYLEVIKWVNILLLSIINIISYFYLVNIASFLKKIVIFSVLNIILIWIILQTQYTKKIYHFIKKVKEEINIIVWNDKKISLIITSIIIIAIILISLVLWILDSILFKVVSWIIKLRL